MFDFSLACTLLNTAAGGIVAWTIPFDTTILGVNVSSAQAFLSFDPTISWPAGGPITQDVPFAAPVAGVYQTAIPCVAGKTLWLIGKAAVQASIFYTPADQTGAT